MDRPTRELVDFAYAIIYDSLSADVIHECKRRLVDTIGCALGAFDDPVAASIRAMASSRSSPGEATLWGTGHSCTAEMAAFANGVMVRIQDFNDTVFGPDDGGHPSDITSAILAVAEQRKSTGKEVIAALAVGYEVFGRFIQSVPIGSRNFDQTFYVGLAAVVAVAKLSKLSREQFTHAISLAVIPNLALRQTRQGQLSHWKGCAAAKAARDAVFAVELAECGVTGPSDAFEGRQGLWSVVGDQVLDFSTWRSTTMVGESYLKNYAVCYHAQAGAEAALGLATRLDGDVASIEIEAYGDAYRMIGSDLSRFAPKSRATADHSLPFTVATCLAHGKLDIDSFDETRLDEPAVVALMKKTTVRENPAYTALYPGAAPTSVTVRMASGRSVTSEVIYPKGHPGSPMTDDEVEAKFNTLAGPRLGVRGCQELLEALWTIDRSQNIGMATMPRMVSAGTAALAAGGGDSRRSPIAPLGAEF